jgi:hypothetical protein
MPIEPWLLFQAADLASQTATQLTHVVAAAQQEAHILLEDITDQLADFRLFGTNGGCSTELPH